MLYLLQVHQLQIPASATLDLASFLADPAVVRQWNLQGLPAGTFSLQNGILITRSQRWPLIIDPQVSSYPDVFAMQDVIAC